MRDREKRREREKENKTVMEGQIMSWRLNASELGQSERRNVKRERQRESVCKKEH